MPTYKRPALLRSCLKALLDQDFDPRAYEIVVVDNAGSVQTRELVEAMSEESGMDVGTITSVRPALYYLEEVERSGPAAARNAGWKFAHGEIIAFTDDDCLPERGWLTEGVRQLREGYDAVTGRTIVPIDGVPTDYEKSISRLETAEFLTANCFIRCNALQATGGFDERFTTAWREDSDLHFRLLSLSLKVGRASRARVVHPVRPAPWGISLKEQRKSRFNALLFKKHPALYRERIQPSPPLRYYGVLISLVGLVAAVAIGWTYLAISMALIWIWLTGQFVVQRLRGTKHSVEHIFEMIITSILIPPLAVYWRLNGALTYRVWFL